MSVPAAFTFAKTLTPDLDKRYKSLVSKVQKNDLNKLKSFEAIIENDGRPSINMNIARCIKFLESNRWLNVFEAKLIECNGDKLAAKKAVETALGKWYDIRNGFEKLLCIRQNAHYAALNLGGSGPDYGDFCVRFSKKLSLGYATIFAGDPLRSAYDSNQSKILTDSEIIKRFSFYGQRRKLSSVMHFARVSNNLVINANSIRNYFDDRDTLIEVHIHGKVTADHVKDIVIRERQFQKLESSWKNFNDASPTERQAEQYDQVQLFAKLLKLVNEKGIPITSGAN